MALAPTVFPRASHLRSPAAATSSSSDLPLLGLGPGSSPHFQRLPHAVVTSRSGDTPGWMTRDARRASRPWLLSPAMVPPISDVPLLPFLPASAVSTCGSAGLLHPATGSGVHCVLATPHDSVIPPPASLGVATSVPWSLTKPPSFPSRELGGDSLRSHSVVAASVLPPGPAPPGTEVLARASVASECVASTAPVPFRAFPSSFHRRSVTPAPKCSLH